MPRKKLDTERIHILVTRRQYNVLLKLSEKSGYSMSELVRRAIDDYLKPKDAKS